MTTVQLDRKDAVLAATAGNDHTMACLHIRNGQRYFFVRADEGQGEYYVAVYDKPNKQWRFSGDEGVKEKYIARVKAFIAREWAKYDGAISKRY